MSVTSIRACTTCLFEPRPVLTGDFIALLSDLVRLLGLFSSGTLENCFLRNFFSPNTLRITSPFSTCYAGTGLGELRSEFY